MTDVLRRWLGAIGTSMVLCGVVAGGTGCGALAAAANPKVAWALNDPAPMSVVVRRADVAEKTAQNVDRLMTDTPASDDSEWLAKVAPANDEATAELVELRKHDLYLTNVKIVAAEVWAKNLSSLESKDGKKPAPAAKTDDTAVASKKNNGREDKKKPAAEPVADAAPVADAPAEEAPVEPVKKSGKGKGKGKGGKAVATANKKQPKVAVNAKGKGKKGSKKSAAPVTDDATPTDTTTTTAATVDTTSAPADKTADAAPASSGSAKYTSLLSAIDKDLGDAYGKVMEKKKAMGDLKGQIAVLETANDEKGISDSDKKANKDKISELEKQSDALDSEASKLSKEFIPKAKEAAGKANADVKAHFGPALVNLQKAVDDANISNGAAAVRYPLAATTLVDSAKTMAKIYIADVIEEKTGKRPSMQAIVPGVSLEGGGVNITINGLDKSDLGKLSMGDLTKEVASRTGAWVKRAAGLLGTISSTKGILSFEDDVLSALLDGFKSGGWSAPAAATIPEAPPAAAQGAQPRS